MSTPFKGCRHIVLLRSASALVSSLTLRYPLLDFFLGAPKYDPSYIEVIFHWWPWPSGSSQACRGHHLKNHLNWTGSQTTFSMPLKIGMGILGTLPNNSVIYRSLWPNYHLFGSALKNLTFDLAAKLVCWSIVVAYERSACPFTKFSKSDWSLWPNYGSILSF